MPKRLEFNHLSKYNTPDKAMWWMWWRIIAFWRNTIEAALVDLELIHPQFIVMLVIGWSTREGASVNQIEIGKTAGLDPNTISQIIRKLELRKLVERMRLTDQRSKNACLTSKGLALLEKRIAAVEKTDDIFYQAALPDQDRQALERVIINMFNQVFK